jgi:hypothetical protein
VVFWRRSGVQGVADCSKRVPAGCHGVRIWSSHVSCVFVSALLYDLISATAHRGRIHLNIIFTIVAIESTCDIEIGTKADPLTPQSPDL